MGLDPLLGGGFRRDRPGDALILAARWVIPAYGLLLMLLLAFDRFDPGAEPTFDLTGSIALVAWVFAESGQTFGIVAIATVLLFIMVTRSGPSLRSRMLEMAIMIVVSIVVLYGGKLLNDNVIKPAIGVARPNIVQLSESDLLGMDVDRFYDMSQTSRSEYLDNIKTETGFGELVMRPQVRDHWVKETASARPSGHSLASLTFATFYLSMAVSVLSGWRRWPFHLLVPWALCVCLSRSILGVHWRADIALGGLVGIVLGAGAYLLTHLLLRTLAPPSPALD